MKHCPTPHGISCERHDSDHHGWAARHKEQLRELMANQNLTGMESVAMYDFHILWGSELDGSLWNIFPHITSHFNFPISYLFKIRYGEIIEKEREKKT